MRNQLQLPVDFVIKPNDFSIENESDFKDLKIQKDGYFYTGEIRLGLSSFLKVGESFISSEEIEIRTDELNAAGSSIWKHFMKNLDRNIPEAWDYNLYFGTFFIPRDSKDVQNKFMFYLKKFSNGKRYGPRFKQVSINFVPKENDKLVCIVY